METTTTDVCEDCPGTFSKDSHHNIEDLHPNLELMNQREGKSDLIGCHQTNSDGVQGRIYGSVKIAQCNQRKLLTAKNERFTQEVDGFTQHLKTLKEDLFKISCKIYELKELKKQKEIEQSRKLMFVCCCIIMYIIMVCCLVLFGAGHCKLYLEP